MSETTKRALGATLKRMLRHQTLDKITVKDLTDACGINRQTFYYHFHDVYELLEWVFQHEEERVMGQQHDFSSWQSDFERLFDYLWDNTVLVKNAYSSVRRSVLEDYLRALLRPRISQIADEERKGLDVADEDVAFVVEVHTLGLVGLTLQWISSGMTMDYRQYAAKFFTLMDGSMRASLAKFERS